MSTIIVFGDERPGRPEVQVATNHGWIEVRDWADALGNQANKDYPELMQLIDHGASHDLAVLLKNLDAALKADKPDDQNVTTTLSGLLDIVNLNRTQEYVLVSDGFFSGYGENQEGGE